MPRCRCQVFQNNEMKLSQRIFFFPEGTIYSIFKHKNKEWGTQIQSLTYLKSKPPLFWSNVCVTFERKLWIRPGRLLNVLCTFSLRSVSTGKEGQIYSYSISVTVFPFLIYWVTKSCISTFFWQKFVKVTNWSTFQRHI